MVHELGTDNGINQKIHPQGNGKHTDTLIFPNKDLNQTIHKKQEENRRHFLDPWKKKTNRKIGVLLMGSGETYFNLATSLGCGMSDGLSTNITKPPNQTRADDLGLHWMYSQTILIPLP